MAAKSRKDLNLEQKVQVIKLSDEGLAVKNILSRVKCGKSQVYNILKRKQEIMEEYESLGGQSLNCHRKRRKTEYDEINRLTYEFFQDCHRRKINLTGPLLQEKALQFASELNFSEFKASNGWLEAFKKRHNIIGIKLSG